MRRALMVAAMALLPAGGAPGAGEDAPQVRPERPRIFLRAKAWDGPSIEKLKDLMKLPEYQARAKDLPRTPLGQAILYLANGDEVAGQQAVEALKKYALNMKDSYSDRGLEIQKLCALYDWLRDHPDFDESSRKERIAYLEQQADGIIKYFQGGCETPFYSRVSGAVAGLTTIGLALSGDSPRADEYVRYAQILLKEKYGTIRQAEDGACGGATYSWHYVYTGMANTAAAWRSATDWDAARWIREHQGDWLQRQLQYQIWMTYPNGWVVKDGDVWSSSHVDRYEVRMAVDAVTGMYRNGFGRTWADGMARRHKQKSDYYYTYLWEFFVFNDPEVQARPLSELPRAEVFSPGLHGMVCWRDSWEDDATIVHFKCGETVDHHNNSGPGKEYLHVNSVSPERTLPDPKWKLSKMPPEMQMGSGRIDVESAEGERECVYLNVLFPADTNTDGMPACSMERKGADLAVKVGEIEYTFAGQQ